MKHIEFILTAIDYIENHLQEPITVADMAAASGYSLYHFCRIFSQISHHPPYDYLMRRRLTQAARKVLETDRKLIDIALDFQFSSPEAFSRAFKRLFNTQPSQIRKTGYLSTRSCFERLTFEKLVHLHTQKGLQPHFIRIPEWHLYGWMSPLTNGFETAENLNQNLFEHLNKSGLHPKPLYGLILFPQPENHPLTLYFAGKAHSANEAPAESLVEKHLPSFPAACFTHYGELNTFQLSLDWILKTWLPQSGKSLLHSWILLEMNPPHENSILIYIPVR
jgi:AraC family transcriptional regulator